MNVRPLMRNRSLFVKLLLSMTAIVIVTVVLISTATYMISADTSIRNSIEANQSVLEQQRELVHQQLLAIENVASGLLMTQSYLYATIDGKLSVGSLIDLTRVLEEQLKLSPYIDSVYLAYDKLDQVLTSRSDIKMSSLSAFPDRSWMPALYADSKSRTLWLTGRANGLAGGKPTTSLLQKMPLIGPVEGAIVINLKLDSLMNDYLSHYHDKKGTTLVLGPQGELLYSESGQAPDVLSRLDASAWSASGSGSYVDDRHWIVTYTTSDRTGWKFVNVTRRSVLLEGLNRIKTLVASVSMLYAAVAVGLSFWISRRLYRPLKSVVAFIRGSDTTVSPSPVEAGGRDTAASPADEASFIRQSFERLAYSREAVLLEKKRMEELLEAKRTAIKEKILSDLIKGIAVTPQEGGPDRDTAELLKLKLDFSRFAVLTIEWEEPAHRGESADKLHAHLFQYRLIEELGPDIDGEWFVRDDERTVVILNVPEGRDELPVEFARNVQQHLESRYGMTATIGISRIHSGVQAVQSAYEESVEALSLKMYAGSGEIVPYAIVSSWKQDDTTYFYPYELETKLLQALLRLDEEECTAIISRIAQEVTARRLGNANVQQLFFQLSGEIVKTLVQTGGELSVVFGDRPFELSGIRTIREMEERLTDMCSRIIAHNREKRLKLNDMTLKLAIEFMENNFNNNITIETVAQHVQRSTSFLSRMFKEATGTTINDYLIHLRIRRACELLRQPNYTLEDICREIGYSNVSYFNKLFKSRTGHTPGQYRLLQAAERHL
jgi:AraC-like DNA-binding protein